MALRVLHGLRFGKNREVIIGSFASQIELLLLKLKLFLLPKLQNSKMMYLCRYCIFSISTASSRTRIGHHFHPDEIVLPICQCSLCKISSRKISNLERHMRTEHSWFTNCCRSWHLAIIANQLHFCVKNSSHPVYRLPFQLFSFYLEGKNLKNLSNSKFNKHSIGNMPTETDQSSCSISKFQILRSKYSKAYVLVKTEKP